MPEQLHRADDDEETMTLLEHCVRRGGLRRGGQVAQFIAAWDIAVRRLGHELGAGDKGEGVSAALREYSTYWKQSERTAWRELDRFRALFPEEESPARLVALFADAPDRTYLGFARGLA